MPEAASVFTGPAEIALTRMLLGAEIAREIAHRAFERGLRHAHHVVVDEHPLGARDRSA